jgi:hypothetical protein
MHHKSCVKIYVIVGTSGKWELHDRWLVKAFSTREAAEKYAAECQVYGDWVSQFYEKRGETDYDSCMAYYLWGDLGEQERDYESEEGNVDKEFTRYKHDVGWSLNPLDPKIDACNGIEYRVEEIELTEW